ncbi:MAG TPA: peptidase domain-containing ABC transporter, partial [Burkholderiaceae bacterium]|nr:peptidase domain-containing ABC transporter [Burkholderiaceae bacterium]
MFGKRVPMTLQSEAPECGIACVAMIASYYGFRTDLSAMRLRLAPSMKGVTLKHISAIADTMKLAARGVKVPLEGLSQLKLPAILHWDMNHFVVLTKTSGDRITVNDPARGRRVLTLREASDHYTGVAMELTPTTGFAERDEREKISAWQLVKTATGLRSAVTQVLLLSLVLEVLAIASPFFLQLVVDRVVVGRDRDLLAVLGIGFGILAVMIAIITALRSWLGVYISTRLNLQLLDTLFARLLRLPLAWFEKRHIGDIVSRFRSVDAIQRTLSLTFLETVMDGVMVIVTLAVMSWYSTTLTIIVVIAAVLYGSLRWAMYGPQRRATDERIVHEAKAATHFIETLRGMMAIKLNLREGERRAAYLNHVVDQTNADVRVQNLALLQRAGNVLIFGLENVIVIWLGANAVLEGQLSVGMLFAFLLFKLLFITRVNNLVDKTIEFRMLDLHADRVADIALAPTESAAELPAVARADAPAGAFVLESRDLGFAYGIEGFVFRGMGFSAKPGETVAIVGPSGSGKTTLVKVLAGLLDRTEGTLTAAGRDVRDWDKGAYRSRIGVVMQDDHLFVGTIEDNISFFDPQHDPARVRECSRLAMIDEDISAMPMGYNTIVGSLGV